jgi:uncharacterized protein (TIGR02466 family)
VKAAQLRRTVTGGVPYTASTQLHLRCSNLHAYGKLVSFTGPGDSHLPHIHMGAAWAGTFYVQVPKGSGSLVLEDPRGGGRPPFHQRHFVTPALGKLVLFPGWLQHHVTPTRQYEAALTSTVSAGQDTNFPVSASERVSFSFNVPGLWDNTADVNVQMPI